MATENIQVTVTGMVAGESLTAKQYHIVKVGSADNEVVAAAAASQGFGVVQNAPASGAPATVGIGGKTKIKIGAAVSRGAVLTADSAGKGVTATTGQKHVLMAMEAGTADGQIISAIFFPGTAL